ncbi:MAG: sigma-54 dependent transcriptional regulator [Pseudomonadota bacterium]
MTESTILVIDDEPSICAGCRLILCEKGHSVSTFTSGRQGLEAIRNRAGGLVLLDIQFPDMNGLEILRTLRQEALDVTVIIMTGNGTVDNAVEAMKQGAFDFITKPFTGDQLLAVVDRAMEARRLSRTNASLKQQKYLKEDFPGIIGEAPSMMRVYEKIERVAPMDSLVLLTGESGTGKELFARAIHFNSGRSARPFLAVDCSTFSPSLLESELFGHIKGAFTGADTAKSGIFETVGNGTLFLDEVSNMDMDIQGKLLRVLETREYKPVGSSILKTTRARIVAATNRDLGVMAADGEFRSDLLYRLTVFPVTLPPLRERTQDIPAIAYHFLKTMCRKTGKAIEGFTDDALATLVSYDWPGNVRQLKNVVERLVILCDDSQLDRKMLRDNLESRCGSPLSNDTPTTLEELKTLKRHILEEHFSGVEQEFLRKALECAGGNIAQAARQVGMQRSNFSAMMKKYDIHA